MEHEQIDLNNVCRTCKNESPEMKSLYQTDSERGRGNNYLRLYEMLMECASVQVNSDDRLPKSICKSCYMQLKNAYSFKELCENTDVFLRQYLKEDCIKEECPTLELQDSPDCIGEVMPELQNIEDNGNTTAEYIKHDPELQPSSDKDIDYIELVENNIITYKCKKCDKDFSSLDDLRFHNRVHIGKTFNCEQCDKYFMRLSHLHRHRRTHSRSKVYSCKICNKTVTRRENLKGHLITHLKEKPHGCSKCNRCFNRAEDLQIHAVCCKGEIVYICDICNRSFKREDSMEVHRRMHENKLPVFPTSENLDNISEYFMEIDFNEGNVFADLADEEEWDMIEDALEPRVIIEEHHQEKTEEITHVANEKEEEFKAEIEEILSSGSENGEADSMDDYESDNSSSSEYSPKKKQSPPKVKRGRGRPRKHAMANPPTRRHRGRPRVNATVKSESDTGQVQQHKALTLHECETCGKRFNRSYHLKRHKLVHVQAKSFKCVICKKCFSTIDCLRRHAKLHTMHQCEICQAGFSRAEILLRHKARKHHTGENDVMAAARKYECVHCSKTFTSEGYRDSHMKAHLGERKFQCRICEKGFIVKAHLVEHMKVHNDCAKEYLCSECGQGFNQKTCLVVHMRRHLGEKPFKCKFCGKSFSRTSDLTVHERYHTGEKKHLCVTCGKGFVRSYNLTVHMRIHTGEKPYRCTYCDAAFAQSNDLKSHVRRHTGERYQCDICPESFLMGYLLTQHKRVAHGLNVESKIKRLTPIKKSDLDDPPPITQPMPAPTVVKPDQLHETITKV